jgi:hypothetical protein
MHVYTSSLAWDRLHQVELYRDNEVKSAPLLLLCALSQVNSVENQTMECAMVLAIPFVDFAHRA